VPQISDFRDPEVDPLEEYKFVNYLYNIKNDTFDISDECFDSLFYNFVSSNFPDLENECLKMFQPTVDLEGYLASFGKYDVPTPCWSDELAHSFDLASTHVQDLFVPILKDCEILSLEDVWNQMDKTTSMGYPLNKQYKNKRDYFEKVGNLSIFEDYWNSFPNCSAPVWLVSSKDELRELSKSKLVTDLEYDKFRVFLAADAKFTSFSNRLCLDFNNKMCSRQVHLPSDVGISKYMNGYSKLTDKFGSYRVGSVDGKSFDAYVHYFNHWENFKLRLMCYSSMEEDSYKRLLFVYQNSWFKYCAVSNNLYLLMSGMPSGFGNTVNDNSLNSARNYFSFYFYFMFYNLCLEGDLVHSYLKSVAISVYGDDIVFRILYVQDRISFDTTQFILTAELFGIPYSYEYEGELIGCKYLGHELQLVEDYGVQSFLPVLPTQRVLSSMAFGGDGTLPCNLLRCVGLLQESWPNKTTRQVLRGYIENLLKLGIDKESFKGIDLKNIRLSVFSDLQYWSMYTGRDVSQLY